MKFNLVRNFLNAALERVGEIAAFPKGPARDGRKTLYTYQQRAGRSRYMPHQGEQECARRRRQMAVGRLC